MVKFCREKQLSNELYIPDWTKKQRNGAKQLPSELKGKSER